MRGNNPVFSRSDAFTRGGYATFDERGSRAPQAPTYGAPAPTYGAPQAMTAEELQRQYQAPAAGALQTGRMTYDDVVVKGALLFTAVLVGAGIGWFVAPGLALPAAILGLVLGLVNAFKREPSPPLMLAYGLVQGVFLGGISLLFESAYSGVVPSAVLATLSAFAAMLVLYKSGRIRVTPKFQRTMLIAVGGYALFCLVSFGLALAGIDLGLRSGVMGLLIGAVGVVLASLSLVLDFDFIDRGVRQGIPARYAWTAAFGLVVTLIWLYIEFLRIFAILQSDD